MNSFPNRKFFVVLLLLAMASGLCFALSFFRIIYSARLTHAGLLWNLFLAWIPMGFALLAWQCRRSRAKVFFCACLWLLFFPNAPYLVTDLVHLRPQTPVPFWFDVILFQSFICLGLLLTFVSLGWMQNLVANLFGQRAGWIFIFFVIGLTGYGIYLGRFQRWNSWDLFFNPIVLFTDMCKDLWRPRRRVAGLYSMLYAGFLLMAYGIFYAFTHLPFQNSSGKNSSPESFLT
ncbi:MAG: DUF1361 domain-containing protein [Verrucomicrobiota bacterium]